MRNARDGVCDFGRGNASGADIERWREARLTWADDIMRAEDRVAWEARLVRGEWLVCRMRVCESRRAVTRLVGDRVCGRS